MAGPQVGLDIVGSDKTGKAFDSAERRAKKLGKSTADALRPVEKIGSSSASRGLLKTFIEIERATTGAFGVSSPLAKLGSHLLAARRIGSAVGNGFGRLAIAANDVEPAGARAAAALGSTAAASEAAGAGMGAAAESGSALVTALGAVAVIGVSAVVVLGAAAVAGYKFAAGWAAGAASLGRVAETIGVTSRALQQLQGAGERYGINKDAMAGSVASFAGTVHDARYGRNNEALALMSKLGVKFRNKADGTLDYDAMMLDFSDALKRQKDPQTAKMLADRFGVTASLPLLRKGSGTVKGEMADVDKHGVVNSDRDIATAQQFQRNSVRLSQLGERKLAGMQAGVARRLAPVMGAGVDALEGKEFSLSIADLGSSVREYFVPAAKKISEAADKMVTATGAAVGFTGGLMEVSGSTKTKAAQIRGFFEKKGWSKAQADGIVANLFAESGFNPRNVGDSGLAYGLAQWHPPRQAKFAALFGHDIRISSIGEQLEFVNWELTHGRGGAQLRRASTPYEAGAAVSEFYEGPKDRVGAKASRGGLAARMDLIPEIPVRVDVHLHDAPPGTRVTVTAGHQKPAISRAMQP